MMNKQEIQINQFQLGDFSCTKVNRIHTSAKMKKNLKIPNAKI